MAKEKLNFRITGKSITYEGHPEKRPKDLMDILAKMGVSEDVVLPTFRENIETQADYTDEQVMEMFAEAKAIREEKKRSKNGGAAPAAAATPTQPSASAEDQEQPQKITLSYAGKQFSYQGLPSGKRNAVLQLLSKQKDVTPEMAVETYRTNLPGDSATDEEIWEMVQAMKNKKSKHHKDANSTENVASTASPKAPTAATAFAASASSPAGHESNTSYDAIDELAGMSSKQRDDLNDFIRQVLEGPTSDVAALLREEPKPRAEAEDHKAEMLTARMSGKIAVYLQEENNTSGTKLIYATASMTYEEFLAVVEKKFGRKMVLSFYEGDDVIELDDDDVLAMYLEMVVNGDPKKLRLICSKPESRPKEVDDQITEIQQQSTTAASSQVITTKAKAYSNGELTVSEDRTYSGHSLAVYCCAFAPKGDLFVTASRDRSVRVWNVRTGSCTVMKGGHNGFVLSCDFSPKGNRVVSSSDDRTIKLWNTSSYSKVATLKGHEDKVYCVKYNPSGEFVASASCDHTVRVWNADTQAKLATLKGHTLAVFSCAFSNSDNGKYVVSGSDDRIIKIWDWAASKEVKSLVGHIGTVWTVCFSHNDKFIVSGSMDYELMLWDVETGTRLRSMEGHKTSVHHAIFSEDDKYIFSCARDWSVMVWRTENAEHVETITGHLSTVYHMDIKGDKLLTSSLDDKLKLWTVKRN
jgi:WD40 repeat protein